MYGAIENACDVARSLGPESDSGELQLLSANLDGRPRIPQHDKSLRRQRRRHIAVVVVVPEDGVDAGRSGQRGERIRAWRGVTSIAPRDVVASQHDYIRPFLHHHRSRTPNILKRDHVAVMEIGDETDAEAFERRRQAGNWKAGAYDL